MASALTDVVRKRFRGYSGARPDVIKLIDLKPATVLDIGCGAGLTALHLKRRYPDVVIVGVEPNPELAALARQHMNVVFESGVEDAATRADLEHLGPFDIVLCADVLEHLVDPVSVLATLSTFLSEGGKVITSIPNVRHVSTFISLGILGTWPRRERGIHDRTHLQFFARKDIVAMGRSAGLRLLKERRNLRLIESMPWTMIPAKLLDFWPFRPFLTFQYLHVWGRSRGMG